MCCRVTSLSRGARIAPCSPNGSAPTSLCSVTPRPSQPEADEDCEEGEAPALPKDDAVRLKPNRSLYQLRTALSHLYKSYKVPPEAGWPHVSSPQEPHACSTVRVQAPPGKAGSPSCAHPPKPLLHWCLQVVHFLGRMDRAILLSASEVTSYNERMRSWVGAFCCVEGKPGHIL